MFSSEQVWKAIDALALRKGMSVSRLAILAGLDPTSLNRSKRIGRDRQPRWVSTETLSKLLAASRTSPRDFFDMVCGSGQADGQPLGFPYPAPNETSKARLLLVDPDRPFRERMAAALEALGYHVDMAPNLGHALALMEHGPSLHALITELRLPSGALGRNLARIALTYQPRLKIFFLTDIVTESAAATHNSAETILQKPLEAAHLAAVVARLLKAPQIVSPQGFPEASRHSSVKLRPHRPTAGKPNGRYADSD